jgi:hypothetical protein
MERYRTMLLARALIGGSLIALMSWHIAMVMFHS